MKYDELSKIALSLAAKVLVKAVGVYDLTQLRDMQGVIIAEFLPILRAPEPVDDKALTEAIEYTQYLSAQGGCEPAPWGPHKQLQLETVLAALRAARQEVAELRVYKERIKFLDSLLTDQHGYKFTVRWHDSQDVVELTDGLGKKVDVYVEAEEEDQPGVTFNRLIDKARAAGEGKGAT